MLRNYLKIAWRNLWRHKAFTALNMGGLTVSLAACFIIFLWVSDELNYDRFGKNADRVFRVGLTLVAKNQPDKQFAVTAAPLAGVLFKDFPEIENTVRFTRSSMLITYRNEHFFTKNFLLADSTFFEVFGFPLVKGDPHTVLNQVNAAVISETTARRYFGQDDPVGKTFKGNDTSLFIVTGVAKDLPATSHFHFDVICSFKQLGSQSLESWWNDSFYTYLLLKDAASAHTLGLKMADIMDKYNAEQNKAIGFRGLHFLQPIKKIHLHSDLRGEIERNGNMSSLRIFIAIAIFLLLVACINYINLTTATSFKRAKEIGMRKVSGASIPQLAGQFLSEAILITLISLILAIGVTRICLPAFNQIAGTDISLSSEFSWSLIGYLVAAAILLGTLAGVFPAFYLSRIRPVRVFKNIIAREGRLLSIRKILVIFQFSLSIMLIIATVIALQQLRYMQSRDVGFDKEQVVGIPFRDSKETSLMQTLKEEFGKVPGIALSTVSSSTPGKNLSNIVVLPEGVQADQTQTMNTLVTDFDFINTYKLKMAAGRAFSKDFGDDSSAFILNQTAVRELGWGAPQNAIGKAFDWGLGKKGKVIGVVSDFNFNSLRQKVSPVVMHILPENSGWYGFLSVRINAPDKRNAIHSLEETWKKIIPGHPFDYFFVDEDYNKQYQGDRRLSNLSMLFSGLTILISCLGLLGLVMVSVSQRTKEIGVRKVLGASVFNVTALLSKDFIKLVLISILIASPFAWWLMNHWLRDFAYRIQISGWVFLFAGIVAVLIAIMTISVRAIQAASMNPVKSLRRE